MAKSTLTQITTVFGVLVNFALTGLEMANCEATKQAKRAKSCLSSVLNFYLY